MDHPADDAPPLVAAPRHLRRRAFHEEIADTLLVAGVPPVPLEANNTGAAKRQAKPTVVRPSAYQRKRLVALVAVIIVSIIIPALVFALILAG